MSSHANPSAFGSEGMNAYWAAVVQSSDDAIITKTLDGAILTWNSGAERMFGYGPSEAVGQPITLIIPPELQAEEADILGRLRAGERIDHYETVRVRKDGSKIDVSLTMSPIRDESGTLIGASKIARDITERKAARRQIEEERQRFEVMLRSIGDGVIVCDVAGQVEFLNPVAERLTGWSSADARGQPLERVFNIINQETRLPAKNPVRRVLDEKVTVGLANHTVLISQSGLEHVIDDSAAPIIDRDQRLRGVVFVFRDVTERRASEEARAWLAAIVESSEDAVIGKDLLGRITSWNSGAERMFGYASREIIGKHVSILIPPNRQAEETLLLEKVKNGERIAHFETVRLARNGRNLDVSLSISPIKNQAGKVIGVAKIARDMTERKRMDLALVEAQRRLASYAEELEQRVVERTARLRETIAELEAFSFSVSHDLRAPLRAIRGFAEAFLEDVGPKLAPEERLWIERVEQAGRRLDRLIEDVLQYSRIGRMEIKFEPVDSERVVADVVRQYPNLNEARQHIRIERPLPPVLAHEPSLVQCLSNLLSNAIKFVRPGVAPEVRVYAQKNDAKVRLVVEDHGIGIAPEHHERIFQMFERLHGQEEFEGTGIGLAIVQKAAQRMGGAVGVESEPGQGSQFWIELPLAQEGK